MTVICLATIIALSSNSNKGSLSSRQSDSFKSDSPVSESLTSSGALDNVAPEQASSPAAAEQQFDSLEDDFDSSSSSPVVAQPTLRRRKSEPRPTSSGEREVEDTTPLPDSAELVGVNPFGPPGPLGSILNQILGDIEVGGLLSAARQNSSADKPFVQKRITKNGATIIISSGALNNSNEASSLLEKLLPPFLRPLAGTVRSGQNGSVASATITMSAEPMFALASGGPSRQFDLLAPSPAFESPRMLAFGAGDRAPLFEGPAGFRSSMFSPVFGPPPPAPMFGHGGLLGMIMRAGDLESSNETRNELKQSSSSLHADQPDGHPNNNSSLKSQASQPQNSTSDSLSAKSNNSSLESDVELIDLMQMAKPVSRKFSVRSHQQQLFPGGSMMLFSTASGSPIEQAPLPSMFMPDLRMSTPSMSPQVMFFGNGLDSSPNFNSGPLNPILRSVLSNVISELSETDKNKTDRLKARTSGISMPSWPFQTSGSELDASHSEISPPSIDRWDDGGKHLRAKHRSSQGDEESEESSDMLTGLQLDQAPSLASIIERQLGSGSTDIVSGTIRQTIRGPGMTVERVIEVPPSSSSSIGRMQQVAPGIKSQSLSRIPEGDTGLSSTFDRPIRRNSVLAGPSSFFGPMRSVHVSDRSDSELVQPHFGFIGRLLSDLGQRSEQMSSRMNPFSFMRSRMSSGDDLDEADSNLDMPPHSRPSSSWPNVHVGSARIRIRPIGDSASTNSDSYMLPPAHLTILEDNDDSTESQSMNHMASPTIVTMNDGKQQSPNFEETLNSVEDRLNNVLSMVSQEVALARPDDKPIDDQQVQQDNVKLAGTIGRLHHQHHHHDNHRQTQLANSPRESASSGVARIERVDIKQVTQDRPNRPDNLFTSPSSPLFGFPSSSIAASSGLVNDKAGQRVDAQQSAPTKPITTFSARSLQPQPVKVHYTGNLSVKQSAGSGLSKSSEQSNSESAHESMLASPSVILGRRMDDSPVPGPDYQQKSLSSFHEQASQHRVGLASQGSLDALKSTIPHSSLTGSFEKQVLATNRLGSTTAKHRTIVV